ncbi:bifunctional folylpolyglutamate synthase/dihydrofolate synthase [Ligilactobacillus cholophilus]|uniref:bifunctional folylpolyglutamate synthase/dihydrofolate synthase n=1 Tax=Ligilactobacillus cholophilus TaxID=3050131 RepID=UPI0025AEE56E|nr:Mur ligase family protein [Ligilactobacillus cholophilus]
MITFNDLKYSLYDSDDRIPFLQKLLHQLGNPDCDYKIIHTAGTNGKTSTSTMIAEILSHNGYNVGLFTSPFVIDQGEAIRINGKKISSTEIDHYYSQVATLITDTLHLDLLKSISKFEMILLIALLYFSDHKVDYVVLECGLGGKTDATNAILTSEYEIFTHIALDHTDELGNTLEQIATNKAAIIRENSQVIVAPKQNACVKTILSKQAQAKNASIYFAETHANQTKIDFTAEYQYDNLATVLQFFTVFDNGKIKVDDCLAVIRNFDLIGRFQQVHQAPPIIIDCAHNLDGISQFVKTVQDKYQDYHKIIITGFLKDKKPLQCSDCLAQLKADFIVTQPDNDDRKYNLETLYQHMQANSKIANVSLQQDSVMAFQTALQRSNSQTVIFVVGSFYLARPILRYIKTNL